MELSNAVLLLAKLLPESKVKAGTASQKSPTVRKSPPSPCFCPLFGGCPSVGGSSQYAIYSPLKI